MPIFDNYTLYYVSIHATIYVYPFIEVGLHVNTTAGRPKCHKIVGGGGGAKYFFLHLTCYKKNLHLTCYMQTPQNIFQSVGGGGGSGRSKRVECRRGVHGLWGGGARGIR